MSFLGLMWKFWLIMKNPQDFGWTSGLEGALCHSFPSLFSYCVVPEISISELSLLNWDLGFWHILSLAQLEGSHRLVAILSTPSMADNVIVWSIYVLGQFTVNSLYAELIPRSSTSHFKDLWRAWISPIIIILCSKLLKCDSLPLTKSKNVLVT